MSGRAVSSSPLCRPHPHPFRFFPFIFLFLFSFFFVFPFFQPNCFPSCLESLGQLLSLPRFANRDSPPTVFPRAGLFWTKWQEEWKETERGSRGDDRGGVRTSQDGGKRRRQRWKRITSDSARCISMNLKLFVPRRRPRRFNTGRIGCARRI